MSSRNRMVAVTAQGALLSAASNTLAQGFTAYRERALSSLDPVAFVHFILLAVLTTPPNYAWQLALERNFPSHTSNAKDVGAVKKDDDIAEEKEKERGDDGKEGAAGSFSITNTLAKFVLDQSIGATLNTVFFIALINLLRGAGWSQIVTALQRDFWPMLLAGYKFWPFVTLLNLAVVPVEQRMLVGGLAGLAWGVYLSLMNL